MTTLVFGSTGNVGQYICSQLPNAVPLSREHYDLSNPDDFSGVHGNNERVSVSGYLQGTEDLHQIVSQFVLD